MQATINEALQGSKMRQISQFEVAYRDIVEAFPVPGEQRTRPSSPAALDVQAPFIKASGISMRKIKRMRNSPKVRGTSDSCPWSWSARAYCFYADRDFNGRRVTFVEERCLINFTDLSLWGSQPFNDKASSWVNNSADVIVKVYRDTNRNGGILWEEGKASNSPYVGNADNDKASSVRTCR